MTGLFGNPNNEKKDRSIFNNAAPIKSSLFPSIHNNGCLLVGGSYLKNSLFPSIRNNDSLFSEIPRNISFGNVEKNQGSLFRFDDNNNNKYDLFAPYKNDKQIDLIIKSSNFNNTNKISKEYEENINNKKKIEKEEKHRNGKSLEFIIFMITILLISILIEQSIILGFLLRK